LRLKIKIFQSIFSQNLLRYVILTFFCLFSCYLNLQGKDYRSILNKGSNQEKLDASWELFKKYRLLNKDSARYFAEINQDIAIKLNDTLSLVKSYNALGYVAKEIGDYLKAISHYENALLLSEKNGYRNQIKYMLNNLATTYNESGNYDKSLEYHFRSLGIREKDKDYNGIAIALNNIGLVYYKIDDNEKAIEYFKKALIVKRNNNITSGLEHMYVNLGLAYTSIGKSKEAIEAYNEALEVCKGDCDNRAILESYVGAGILYYESGEYEIAKDKFSRAGKIAEEFEDKLTLITVLFYKAKLSNEQNNQTNPFEYLDKAHTLAKDTEATVLKIEINNLYADLYKESGNYEKAFYHRDLASTLKDSVFNDDLIKNIANLQLDYQEQQTQQIIASKDFQIDRRERINLLLGGITLLVLVLVFILFKNIRLKQRANKNLAQAKNIIEQQNRELTDVNAILEERVKERTKELNHANRELKKSNEELDNFIYKTSHDIRGPLATLLGVCNIAQLDVTDEQALDYFKKLNITATKLNEILSKLLIINQINNSAPQTENVHFPRLLNELIKEHSSNFNNPDVEIKLNIDKDVKAKSDLELLKVIYGNLISNAFKFRDQSKRVKSFLKINLLMKNKSIVFQIIDNGIGIDQAESERIFEVFSKATDITDSSGIGLYLVKLAVEKLDGNIFHGKTDESYTYFEVTLPHSTEELESKNKEYINS